MSKVGLVQGNGSTKRRYKTTDQIVWEDLIICAASWKSAAARKVKSGPWCKPGLANTTRKVFARC